MNDSSTRPDYLTPEQILSIRTEMDRRERDAASFFDLLHTVDKYVRANGKNDVAYERMYALMDSIRALQLNDKEYDETITVTFPVISSVIIYDYLIFAGVMRQEELLDKRAGFPPNNVPKA